MTQDVATEPRSPAAGGSALRWGGVLAAGVVLTLVAQFAMDALSDGNETWHWAQHAALFWGGLMVGVAAVRLYQLGRRVA